jgi:hypothetical protein
MKILRIAGLRAEDSTRDLPNMKQKKKNKY